MSTHSDNLTLADRFYSGTVYLLVRGRQFAAPPLAGLAGAVVTPLGALFSCFAAARAACVSTWLGELVIHNGLNYQIASR